MKGNKKTVKKLNTTAKSKTAKDFDFNKIKDARYVGSTVKTSKIDVNLNPSVKEEKKETSKKNWVTKKKIVLSTMATTVVAIPTMVAVSQFAMTDVQYKIGDKVYNSLESAKNSLLKEATVEEYKKESDKSYWTLQANGVNRKFKSPEQMKDFVYNEFISKQKYASPFDLNKKVDINTEKLMLSNEEWRSLVEFDSSKELQKTTVYKKANGGFTQNKEEGYASYFSPIEGFFFDGMYFNSREEVKNYLLTDYLPNNKGSSAYNSFILIAPNGVKSSPISSKPDSIASTLKYISDFIRENANSVLTYKNSQTGNSYEISHENANSVIDNIYMKDLNYQHMYSNQGESRYIFDNRYDDEHNLIGPYFYKGTIDVGSFTNKSMWKKVNGISKATYVQSKVDAMIGSFFTSIINDDLAIELMAATDDSVEYKPVLFRTLLERSSGVSLDEWFLDQIKEKSPALYKDIIKTNQDLMNGKKYNTFTKIPVMYSFIMSRIVQFGLGTDLANLTIYYFSQVADFVQDAVEMVLNANPTASDSLLKGKDGTFFDVKSFFQIGNPEFDLNTSIETFLTLLKTNFPKLVAAMASYVSSVNNLYMTNGLIPFDSVDFSFLFDFKILTEQDLKDINNDLKNIYETFSALDSVEMTKLYVERSKNTDVMAIKQHPAEEWETELDKLSSRHTNIPVGVYLRGVGGKNTQYSNMAASLIIKEIEIFKNTALILNDGFLSRLFDKDPSKDRLHPFIQLYDSTPNIDVYRAYMAIFIDKKMNTNIFNTDESISDPYRLSQNIVRLIFAAFGTVAGTSTTIKNIYSSTSSSGSVLPTPVGRSVGQINNNGALPRVETHPIWDNIETIDVADIPQIQAGNQRVTRGRVYVDGIRIPRLRPISLDAYTFQRYYSDFDKQILELHPRSNTFVITRTSDWKTSNQVNPPIPPDVTVPTRPPGTGRPPQRPTEPPPPPPTTTPGQPTRPPAPPPYKPPPPYPEQPNPPVAPAPPTTPTPPDQPDPTPPVRPDPPTTTPEQPTRPPAPPPYKPPPPYPEQPNPPTGGGGSGGSSGSGGSIGGGSIGSAPSVSVDGPDGILFDANHSFVIDDPHSEASSRQSRRFSLGDRSGRYSLSTTSRWSGSQALSSIKNYGKIISDGIDKVMGVFGTMFVAAELFFLIYDLLKVEEIQDFYVYTLLDGTEFIWDGGKTISRFFGMQTEVVSGVDSMKLVDPVQITLPNVEEFYYYNSSKYYDAREIKYAYIKNLLNTKGEILERQFSKKYSFDKMGSDGTYGTLYDSLDDLVKGVSQNIGIYEEGGVAKFDKINKDSPYVSSTSYIFADGVTTDSSNTNNVIADNIYDNIRPVKVMKKVEVIGGEVIDNTKDKMVLPGLVWTNHGIVDNTSVASQYIVDMSANEMKNPSGDISSGTIKPEDYVTSNPKEAGQKSTKILFDLFKSLFDLNSKVVLENQVYSNNMYDDLSMDIFFQDVYKATIPGFGSSYYTSPISAEKFIWANLKTSKVVKYETAKKITYNGLVFHSEEEFSSWIESHKI